MIYIKYLNKMDSGIPKQVVVQAQEEQTNLSRSIKLINILKNYYAIIFYSLYHFIVSLLGLALIIIYARKHCDKYIYYVVVYDYIYHLLRIAQCITVIVKNLNTVNNYKYPLLKKANGLLNLIFVIEIVAIVFFQIFGGECDHLKPVYLSLLVYCIVTCSFITILYIISIHKIFSFLMKKLSLKYFVLSLYQLGYDTYGLTEKQIDSLPIYTYKNNGIYGKDNNLIATIEDDKINCIMCGQNYTNGDPLRVFSCNHHVHKKCGDIMLNINASCPYCHIVV